MRVYISVDMEGISGVTRWADVVTRGQDYQRARSWMTGDVNAAVEGARRAGATSFVVEENHGVEALCNLVLDEIDPEVDVVRGQPRQGATTMWALDESCSCLFLVGHHAAVKRYPGICAHTISYEEYADVRCNGVSISEGEMFSIAAAQRGVPTALVSSDDVCCADMTRAAPGIECAVVKRALSREAGVIIPPVRAQRLIADAAERAVRRVADGAVALPTFAPTFDFEIEFRTAIGGSARDEIGHRFPEFRVEGDRTLAFTEQEMARAFRKAAIASYLVRDPGVVRSY